MEEVEKEEGKDSCEWGGRGVMVGLHMQSASIHLFISFIRRELQGCPKNPQVTECSQSSLSLMKAPSVSQLSAVIGGNSVDFKG